MGARGARIYEDQAEFVQYSINSDQLVRPDAHPGRAASQRRRYVHLMHIRVEGEARRGAQETSSSQPSRMARDASSVRDATFVRSASRSRRASDMGRR